jgi:hypothetical protein
MTERPIIFSGPMVRALLADRKTMTRRLATSPLRKCEPGDRLWVRESYSESHPGPVYKADNPNSDGWGWRPSIHMPRSASRITLEVTAVKIERLQEITPADAEAEGVFQHVAEYSIDKIFRDDRAATARLYFLDLWEKLHGLGSWDANPEVVAISFRRATATAPPPQRGTL